MQAVKLIVGLAVLAGLLATFARTLRRPTERAAWLLLVLGALWFALDQPLEGPRIYVYSSTHALTAADLLSCAAAALALVVLVRTAARATSGAERFWGVLTVVALSWTLFASGVLLAATVA